MLFKCPRPVVVSHTLNVLSSISLPICAARWVGVRGAGRDLGLPRPPPDISIKVKPR